MIIGHQYANTLKVYFRRRFIGSDLTMLSPIKNNLLIVSDSQFEFVRNSYNLQSKDIKQHVDSIIEWFNSQKYSSLLSEPLDRGRVERIFILNKCSMEKTKNKLENYYKNLHKVSELFENRNPKDLINVAKRSVFSLPLPLLSSDGTRVFITTFRSSDTEYYDSLTIFRQYFMMQQYRQEHDYTIGVTHVCDFRLLTFKHIFLSSPFLLKKSEYVDKNILGNRLAAVHIISNSWHLKYILAIAKMALPTKLRNRIKIHYTLESLHQDIPKKILPVDFGGEEKIFSELIDDWEAELCTEKQNEWNMKQDCLILKQRQEVAAKKW